jgi:hypothetical protein
VALTRRPKLPGVSPAAPGKLAINETPGLGSLLRIDALRPKENESTNASLFAIFILAAVFDCAIPFYLMKNRFINNS